MAWSDDYSIHWARYHRPIASPEHFACNRFVAADSDGRATSKKMGLAAPLAREEKNDEYY